MTSMTLGKLLLPAILLPLAVSGCGASSGKGTTTPVGEGEAEPVADGEGEGASEEKPTPTEAEPEDDLAAAMPVFRRQIKMLVGNYMMAGGYWAWKSPYAPGDWVRWKGHFERVKVVDESDEPQEVELAFLGATDDGDEWWRLAAYMEDGSSVTFELLLAKDRGTIVKLLGRRGESGKAVEIKLAGDEAAVPAARQLNRKDVEAKKGKLLDFKVDEAPVRGTLITWKAVDGKPMELFHTKVVPGGLLRMTVIFDDGAQNLIELVKHGKGATSVLGAL